jgi:hypothetical protein
MVRQIKSNCCSRLRTRTERTTFKRAGNHLTGDKESKLTTIRTHMKNDHQYQRDAAIECEL